MRTKALLVCLTLGFLSAAQSNLAAGNRTTISSRRASFESRQSARPTRGPAIFSQRAVSGVIPRALRGGNPLQMVNPFAPAKYGTARESISVNPDVPGQVNGINFV
ncbi:MAG: hypothetical protein QOG27_1935, partial [Verrucomicrobiota bacterium]